ncbi:Uncharacterized protein APZ42_006421 [Daphnia magna]|uniref:Uncharacterized protein n=1 Tax=Daphnia magna TaxID=35525 RepID=A0A164FWW0_9CRUS|nr:Uncharacterized protein APZ42_006421 [Daphnia magna]
MTANNSVAELQEFSAICLKREKKKTTKHKINDKANNQSRNRTCIKNFDVLFLPLLNAKQRE